MVEVVTDTGRDEDGHVLDGQLVQKTTQVDEAVHHLRHAETVPEVVERVVAVVLLNAQLYKQRRRHLASHFVISTETSSPRLGASVKILTAIA